MSFGDIYSAPPGSSVGSNAPGLPPVNLPQGEPPPRSREPLRVTVRPEPVERPWLETAPKWQPPEAAKKTEPSERPWLETAPKWEPEEPKPEIGTGEAFQRNLGNDIAFGAAPALEGLAAASLQPAPATPSERASGSAAYRPIQGLINLLRERDQGVTGLITGPGPATKAYRQARDEAQTKLEASREQHPIASTAGMVAGSLLAPVPGTAKLAQGASLPTRLLRGAVTGGTAGALYGAGTSFSKGNELAQLDQIVEDMLASGASGAAFGSTFHGAVGPRAPRGNTPGQIAQTTAEKFGTPLPRGLVSDNPAINAATAKLRSFPIIGSGISGRVQNFEKATGEELARMAQGSRGVAPNRDLAGASLREALGGRGGATPSILEKNHQAIENAYDNLQNISTTHMFSPRDHTVAAVKKIIASRRGARQANPEAGLEDILNILSKGQGKGGTFGGGINFRGLQRARSRLSEKLQFPAQHPGFDVNDGLSLRKAITEDMKEAVRKYVRPGFTPQEAEDALNNAHRIAADYITRNNKIQKILDSTSNERLVGSLLSAVQERGGDIGLIRQLRASMDPRDFEHLGAVELAELGRTGNGEFSAIKMLTGWNKIKRAAPELFSPQHLDALNNILTSAGKIRNSLSESNVGKSETAGVIILFDLAKDAVMFSAALGAGAVTGHALAGAAAGVPLAAFTFWLSRPATAQSMSRWVTAYRALTLGVPTPARRAAFNIATRNLANTLGVPAEQILKRVAQETGGEAAIPQPQALPAR